MRAIQSGPVLFESHPFTNSVRTGETGPARTARGSRSGERVPSHPLLRLNSIPRRELKWDKFPIPLHSVGQALPAIGTGRGCGCGRFPSRSQLALIINNGKCPVPRLGGIRECSPARTPSGWSCDRSGGRQAKGANLHSARSAQWTKISLKWSPRYACRLVR